MYSYMLQMVQASHFQLLLVRAPLIKATPQRYSTSIKISNHPYFLRDMIDEGSLLVIWTLLLWHSSTIHVQFCFVYSYFNKRCRIKKAKRQDRNVLWDYFMNNFIKIIPARAGHCTANYNLLFSPGMTDFDEFIHQNPT